MIRATVLTASMTSPGSSSCRTLRCLSSMMSSASCSSEHKMKTWKYEILQIQAHLQRPSPRSRTGQPTEALRHETEHVRRARALRFCEAHRRPRCHSSQLVRYLILVSCCAPDKRSVKHRSTGFDTCRTRYGPSVLSSCQSLLWPGSSQSPRSLMSGMIQSCKREACR